MCRPKVQIEIKKFLNQNMIETGYFTTLRHHDFVVILLDESLTKLKSEESSRVVPFTFLKTLSNERPTR